MDAQDIERRLDAADRFAAWRRSLPDSRLRNRRITIRSPIGELQPVFCLNCGRPNGAVTTGPDLPDVTFICEPCAERYGGLPAPEVPESEIAKRRA